jgi:hypothetical protein
MLWAILAYSSVQHAHADLHLRGGEILDTVSGFPAQYYHNAEKLVLASTATFTTDYVNALLILALIDMGFRNVNRAWLCVGQHCYLIAW